MNEKLPKPERRIVVLHERRQRRGFYLIKPHTMIEGRRRRGSARDFSTYSRWAYLPDDFNLNFEREQP